MVKSLVALTLVSVVIVASAASQTRNTSKREVLAATKQLSASDCRPHGTNEVRITSCEYSATFANGQWSVDVLYIEVDKNGERIFPFGTSATYVFDSSGKFIKIIPGQ